MPNPPCDLLISASLILTDFAQPPVRNAAVAIQDNRIAAVGPAAELRAYWQPNREMTLDQQLLIPGLVNAHTQLASRLQGNSIDHTSAEQLQLGIDLELMDLIQHGITTIADASMAPALVAERCIAAGMRAQIATPLGQQGNRFSRDAAQARTKTLAMMDEWRPTPLITVAFGPGFAGPLTHSQLQQMQILADELDAPVQLHLDSQRDAGWATRLDELGVLNPRLQAIVSRPMDQAEIALLGERGVSIVHTPLLADTETNAVVSALQRVGCNIALGTGSSADHRAAAVLNAAASATRGLAGSTAVAALTQASVNGSRALGATAGGIAAGQPADLASFDLREPALQPTALTLANCAASLLRGASSLTATNVWIDGVMVLSDRAHCTLNRTEILTRAGQWQATMPA